MTEPFARKRGPHNAVNAHSRLLSPPSLNTVCGRYWIVMEARPVDGESVRRRDRWPSR